MMHAERLLSGPSRTRRRREGKLPNCSSSRGEVSWMAIKDNPMEPHRIDRRLRPTGARKQVTYLCEVERDSWRWVAREVP